MPQRYRDFPGTRRFWIHFNGNAVEEILKECKLTALDKALEMKLQVITDLAAQIAALKAAPAATSTAVVDDTKQDYKQSEPSDFDNYCNKVNAARELYNEIL